MDTRRKRKNPPGRESLNVIHNLVVSRLVRGRPPWTASIVHLEGLQPSVDFVNEEGRLCFYCLGLFKKQSFQIDHIRPSVGRLPTIANYNNPSNLIPVCRTCNTSKSDKALSTAWLNEQIGRRQAEGLPGLENATNVVITDGSPDNLTFGINCRRTVLGL